MKNKLSIKENANTRRKLSEAEEGDIVSFSELSPAQQDYIRDNWYDMNYLSDVVYDAFNESSMDWYHENVNEFAKECTDKCGVTINTDKLHWQSNSRGPYPEWSIAEIFDDFVGRCSDGEDYYLNFVRYNFGDKLSVADFATVEIQVQSDDGEYYWETFDCNASDLEDAGVDQETIDSIFKIVDTLQDFIDKVWENVHEVCTDYPDNGWAIDLIDANDYGKYEIIDDKTVYCLGL